MDTSPMDSEVESETASTNPRLRALKSADNTPIESGDDCSEKSKCKQTQQNKNKTSRNSAGTPTSPSSTVSVESEIGSAANSSNNQNRKRVSKRQVPTSIDTINEVVNKMSADRVSTASASSVVAKLKTTETAKSAVVSNTETGLSKKGVVKKQRSEGSSDTLVDEPIVSTKSQQNRQLRRSTETLTDQQADNQNKQLNSSTAESSNSADEVSATNDDQPEKWSRSKSYAHAIDI